MRSCSVCSLYSMAEWEERKLRFSYSVTVVSPDGVRFSAASVSQLQHCDAPVAFAGSARGPTSNEFAVVLREPWPVTSPASAPPLRAVAPLFD
jgi:hypothetical protein